MIWRIIEPLVVAIAAIFLVSQVVIPPFVGKSYFWIFKRSEKRLRKKDDELSEVKTKRAIKEKDRAINRIKRDLNSDN